MRWPDSVEGVSVNEEARAEAERRYPRQRWYAMLGSDVARAGHIDAFVAGTEWERARAAALLSDTGESSGAAE